jgi:TM2 domain-containing membrane protein YozV
MAYCSTCGSPSGGGAFCPNCGAGLNQPFAPPQVTYGVPVDNKKVAAGVCALVVGGLGVHKFILGYKTEGILQIVITIFTCGIGAIIPFIEGIIYLTKSDQEFYNTYQLNKKTWF